MDFNYIPLQEQSKIIGETYTTEIFRIFSSPNKNAQKLLETRLSQFFNDDLRENLMTNTLCILIKDIFESKRCSFLLIIDKSDEKTWIIKVNIKDVLKQKFIDSITKLENYLKRLVFEHVFPDLLIIKDEK